VKRRKHGMGRRDKPGDDGEGVNGSSLKRLGILAPVLAVLALCACNGSVRAPCAKGKVCLEYGNQAEPGSLDPAKAASVWEDHIVGELLVGLTQDDAAGNPVPGVATSWETSPDGLVWTFHLRDARWSDGEPVTADDFVFALRRLLDPKTGSEYASLMYILKNGEAVNEAKAPLEALGVRALDPRTLQITLEHPAPYLLELTKHQTMYPEPRHVVERWGDAWTQPQHYVVDGPYRLVEWKFGDHIRVVKNPSFFDADKVCIDQVDFYPTIDDVAAERRVRRGELDLNANIQLSRIALLRRPDQIPAYVHTHTYLGVYYLIVNQQDVPALKDRRVRLALSMAIDRDFMVHKLSQAGNPPAYSFVPPGVAGYHGPPPPAWASWPFERRQATARALLAQAGYGPGHPLTVEIKHFDSADTARLMASVQSDWKAIGVTASLAQEEPQVGYQDFRLRNFQIGFVGWIADYNDPMSFLYLQQSTTGSMNYGGYANPQYDALLAKADQEPDAARRASLLADAEQILMNDQAIIPIWFTVSRNLVNPKVTGWVDNITDQHRIRYLCMKPAG
jgi:oligopeptide transport system substrate-binding protein